MSDLIALQKAVTLRPYDPSSYEVFCRELCRQGRADYAADFFRRWLRIDPDNARAQHFLAACTGVQVPPRCSDRYLETEFDSFAPSFERQLHHLGYVVPELIGDLLLAEAPAAWNVLDIGCGTGLCGRQLRPIARCLVGVDLSTNMLALARQRGDYDELHQREITEFLAQHPMEFDAITAGDVLIYFGDLATLFALVARALAPSGRFVANTELLETSDGGGYRLELSGRYAHAREYVEQHAREAGLALRSLDRVMIRHEAGKPVAGLIVNAVRAL